MTKTNKAFIYITDTARDDQKVARALSGWEADASPKVIDIAAQDHTTRERLRCLQELLFTAQLKGKRAHVTTEQEQVPTSSDQEPKPKRRKNQATNLSAAWYEWYTKVPRVWDSRDRQKKSEFRHVVAFMKLFLPQDFALDVNAEDYRDQVLDAGSRAEDAVLAFLKARGTNAKGAGSVLRALRPLHKSGALDERIYAYKRLLVIARIEDPAPVDTQDIFTIVCHA
ncbi:Hypothetical protein PHPALM_36566 [Phytophthora palmivora]|uniref:Uncharacterized protein n=1 Tax=Phytophthora palmivora TaxID=4796 RepID=A0A2P4WZM3_9STRA|nr:Hypothetical protein PHPALM_36566 [Phytophthora palmivora]